jgi:beta-phosphoglucomutase family hydrolase
MPVLAELIRPDRFDAVLFDLDGVLTSTASIHSTCWKSMFDAFLRQRAEAAGVLFVPFDIDQDYPLFVDGKLRYDGVQSFLSSRRINLPYGSPEDDPQLETVCGLGNRKDTLVKKRLDEGGIEVFAGSIAVVKRLLSREIRTAVVSASKNCKRVLESFEIRDLFEQVVDGEVAEQLHLAGKPAPDTFIKGAELLGVDPSRAVVVEDAISGVQAGRAGGFGLVIGVDRHGDADALLRHGADVVVADLGELL